MVGHGHMWLGDDVGPGGMHRRVINARGNASEHLCESCGLEANGKWSMDWSQIHGTSGLDIYDYRALCRKCHMLYDKSSLVVEQVLEIRSLLLQGIAQHKIADLYNVSQMTISRINTGRTWCHI